VNDQSNGTSWLAATLPVLELAVMSVEAVRQAALRIGATGRIASDPVDPERVAAAFGSDKLFRYDGCGPSGFAPMSGFFAAADGWVRTHANYPHHAQRLAKVLELRDSGREAAAAAIAPRSAADLEELAATVGAILVRVRSEKEWNSTEMGRAAAVGELTEVRARDDQKPLTLRGGERPLAGVRVLDMTRVTAGPVCTRSLALLGAEVLRVDPPQIPEIEWQHLDSGHGKRSTLLDLRRDLSVAQALLDSADVLVTGYRPGAIERFGLRPPPGVIRARINAWGDTGPWASRRGFDSIVQAVCGIALIESPDGTTPGALPAQALDHASGYRLAAGVIDALAQQVADHRGRDVHVSLARTARDLLERPGQTPDHMSPAQPTERATVTHGQLTTARPAIPGFDDYPRPPHQWGTDVAAW
jgi:crotonobetainyl-CoA:carnitine CoA-transferase CaiB-like acyl-CoA transferase